MSVPHPLRAVRRSSRRLSRYAQITGIAVKHGFGPLLGLGPPPDDDPAAPPVAPAAAPRSSTSGWRPATPPRSPPPWPPPTGSTCRPCTASCARPGPGYGVAGRGQRARGRADRRPRPGPVPPGRGAAALRPAPDAGRRPLPRRPPPGQRAGAGRRPPGADRLRGHRPARPPPAGLHAGDAGRGAAARRRAAALGRARGGHPAPPLRRRPAGAGSGPLHGQAPAGRSRPQRGHVQRSARSVLRLRDQPAAGVLDLLRRPRHPGRTCAP